MKTSSTKVKEMGLQKLIADKLTEITGIPNGPDEMIFSRPMGQSGADIGLVGKARKLVGFAFECKNHEKFSMHQWIRQSQNNEKETMPWCVVVGKNRFKPFVTMDILSFKALLKYKARGKFEKLFYVYEYFQQTWKMEKWVLDARKNKSSKPWLIITTTDSKRVVTIDLETFIDLLKFQVRAFNEIK